MTHTNPTKRPPVVAIMGHIDHGKSTLLSYIRNSTKALREAGGITQHISAYEIDHAGQKITFLDTPGHEAFSGHRVRGATVADIAVLVVSAEDGVKPQTLEALNSIKESGTPFVVAITKIDKPEANIDQTKQSLAENGIYVEGYGGDVAFVPVSGKSGAGVSELLDLILLASDIEDLTGDTDALASGMIIESNLDSKMGLSATCIITNGHMKKGMFVASVGCVAPVRVMEDWTGKPVQEAMFSSPVKLIGWSALPHVGARFQTFLTKDEATAYSLTSQTPGDTDTTRHIPNVAGMTYLPLVIKADAGGSLEAILTHVQKLCQERICPKVVFSGIGTISENDIRMAKGTEQALVIGFTVKTDAQAKTLAERDGITIMNFDVIYKLSEWLEEKLKENTPTMEVEEQTGEAKVLKVFSKVKDKQIIGCRMETGRIAQNETVKIMRRDAEIGTGKVRELQSQKNKISEVEEGKEFGTMIEAKMEIAPGDKLRVFTTVRK